MLNTVVAFLNGLLILSLLGCASGPHEVSSGLSTVSVARVGGVAANDYFCKDQKPLRLEGASEPMDIVFCAENPDLIKGGEKDGYHLLPWGYRVVGRSSATRIFESDSQFSDAYKVMGKKIWIRRYESLGSDAIPVYDYELSCTGARCERRQVSCAPRSPLPESTALDQLKKKSFNDDFLMQGSGPSSSCGRQKSPRLFYE